MCLFIYRLIYVSVYLYCDLLSLFFIIVFTLVFFILMPILLFSGYYCIP